jgi:hypothetical protein
MEEIQGYQCENTDCGIIIKADGRLEFVYPVEQSGIPATKSVAVFKQMLELVNEHMLHEDAVSELAESIRVPGVTLH